MANYKFETLQLHVGQEQPDPASDARAVPIYQTTSYVFKNSDHAQARFGLADAGNIYGRLTNSTQGVFEDRIAALEGGSAGLAVASGAAALSYTFQALAQAGDHIVAAKTIYGGTYNYLEHTFPQHGVTTTFVDPDDPANFEAAIQENTKAVFIETLGNPNSNIIDIQAVADIAHKHNIPLVVDDTFTTPYLIRPFEYGADIVAFSATKFVGGHGTTLGGVIVESGKFDWKASGKFPQIADPNPSYHGISFADAVGPAAFVTYIRAIILRDTGAHFRRLTHFFSFREQKHFRFALKDMLKTLKRLLNTSTIIRLLKKSTTRHLIQDIANFITSIFPTAQAQSLHLTLRAAKKKQRNSSTRFRFSQFLQMLPMLNHLLFTRQQQLTAN